ncbi:hypothetical protein [Jeongeupia chitinilytica]|uniref:O-antigen ligase domain-containing protein n=1 Tax=Jeongeupia chitinilytica TaxID=1041641 RepID=A0ABQ3GXN9_9NEIS|nr:hypothetical protein [Jeongeupia chitinilytica]GHD56382.1 hypothetical protein GCM10007350_03360 [Jeongeupia chitinilytica]
MITAFRAIRWPVLGAMTAALGFCALVGAAIAVATVQATAAVLALVVLAVALVMPARLLFWALVVAAFLIAGPVQYFGGVTKAFWLPYLMGCVLLLRVVFAVFGGARSPTPLGLSGYVLLLFLATLGFATVVNLGAPLQLLLSLKEFLFLLPLLPAFYIGLLHIDQIDRFWRCVPWLALLQLPAVLYQYLVIAPSRSDASRWDCIVGLFGGDPMGGGASGAMVLFVVFAGLLTLSMWREGLLGWRVALLVGLGALTVIMLTEVKVALLMLPLGLLFLFRSELIKKPATGLAIVGGGLAVLVGILLAYQAQFSGDAGSKEAKSIDQYIATSLDRQADAEVNMQTGEMGRGYALKFWLHENDWSDPLHLLVGHGVGASRTGAVMGSVARLYPFDLQRSSAAVLLWESGAIGFVCVVLLLLTLMTRAWQAANTATEPMRRAVLNALVPGALITALGLGYNTDLYGVGATQTMVLLMAAYIMLARRESTPR